VIVIASSRSRPFRYLEPPSCWSAPKHQKKFNIRFIHCNRRKLTHFRALPVAVRRRALFSSYDSIEVSRFSIDRRRRLGSYLRPLLTDALEPAPGGNATGQWATSSRARHPFRRDYPMSITIDQSMCISRHVGSSTVHQSIWRAFYAFITNAQHNDNVLRLHPEYCGGSPQPSGISNSFHTVMATAWKELGMPYVMT
jgi:hypothetical protein